MERVKTTFEVIKRTLQIDDISLIDGSNPELFNQCQDDCKTQNALGMAYLQKKDHHILNMDLFKPENEPKRALVREAIRQGKKSIRVHRLSVPDRSIFINVSGIEECYNSGYGQYYLKLNIPWYGVNPVTVDAIIAAVTIHEFTHIQMDIQEFEGCKDCIFCEHCEEFKKRYHINWKKVIDLPSYIRKF